jgi:hypothetical protein
MDLIAETVAHLLGKVFLRAAAIFEERAIWKAESIGYDA